MTQHPTIEAAIQAAAEKAVYEIWTETTPETPRDTLKRIIVRHATEELSRVAALSPKPTTGKEPQ